MTTTSEYWDTFITRIAQEQVSKALAKRGGELTDLHVEEISAVDRPANKRKWLVVNKDTATKADVPPVTRSVLWGAMEILASDIRKHEPTLTREQAIVKVHEQQPELLALYERLEPDDPPEPVKKEAPPTPTWDRVTKLAEAKLDQGDATTIEQARELVFGERPDLFRQASAER